MNKQIIFVQFLLFNPQKCDPLIQGVAVHVANPIPDLERSVIIVDGRGICEKIVVHVQLHDPPPRSQNSRFSDRSRSRSTHHSGSSRDSSRGRSPRRYSDSRGRSPGKSFSRSPRRSDYSRSRSTSASSIRSGYKSDSLRASRSDSR